MKRPYLALATLLLGVALAPAPELLPRAWGEGLFSSAPVEASSFSVLARPVGADDWTLVVLEQLAPRPFCWTPRPDGLVDPTLNRFDFTGICGRFIDSNGYSLRVAATDLGHAYRLRLQQQGNQLYLFASSPSAELLVARGTVPRRDRDLFVSLQLEKGWDLQRRVFGGRNLNHIYFNSEQPLDRLVAAARGRSAEPVALVAAPPTAPEPPPQLEPRRGGRQRFRQAPAPTDTADLAPATGDAPGAIRSAEAMGPGVVQLQVIPYEDRISSDSRAPSQGRAQPVLDPFAQAQGL